MSDICEELNRPLELRTAYQISGWAVIEAYSFGVKAMSETDCAPALIQICHLIS
ncbi:MAG: hypothetical protein Q4F00_06240 [bacterium]|nr:hypothetical protein [bacterium]